MKRPDQEPVLRLADAIAEGDAVDWQRASAELPSQQRTLDSLRVVESILQGYRALAQTLPARAAEAGAPAARRRPMRPAERTVLFRWGPLAALEKIGEGSFGEVYRAHDPALEREVALKLWRTPEAADTWTQRFLAEARRLARVSHPNVLVVHGADVHDGRAGMWTDLIRGESLEQILARQGPCGAREAGAVGIELCGALAAVHAAGLVHRDVKTTNVMRERGGRIVLMDFGAVGELTPFGAVRLEDGAVGTPLTLAPEQLEGEAATPASDVYGLGVLMFRLLTGVYPVEARTLDELHARHRRGERLALRDRRPDLPAAFVRAVEGALEPRDTRYQGAGAMERGLAEALAVDTAPRAEKPLPATELPEAWTRFRGRERALDACLRDLDEARVVAIVGPAGAGKTRLALHLAARLRDRYPGGVRFVDLERVSDAARVPHALAAACDARVEPGADAMPAIAERVRGTRTLLVVDGGDRVLDAVARAGEALLVVPELSWIVASRHPPGIPGERVLALEPWRSVSDAETAAWAPAGAPRVPFVGRERELAVFHEILDGVLRGEGRMLLLGGEAGVGKSRLMEEAQAIAAARGLLCLGGRCSYRSGRNFEPFLEAVEEFTTRFAPRTGRAAPGRAGAPDALFHTLEGLLGPGSVLEPRSREHVWRVVGDLIERLCRFDTVALFLDDLHWADEGTLSLLHHLARRLGGARLLLVGAYRPEELAVERGDSSVEDALLLLSSAAGHVRMALAPLDAATSATLVARMVVDAGLAGSIAPSIHDRARGNPFFTIELVRDLASAGSLAARGDLVLPRTVADVVSRRLARLTPEERDALDLAAVEGERFHADTLAAGTGRPRIELLKTLRALEQVHHLVVAAEDGHRFSHGMIREVLLAAVPAELLREYHGIVADHWIARHGDHPDQASRIADQLFEAQRWNEAWPRMALAAREARRLFLHDRALQFLERGLAAFDRAAADPEARGELLRARYEVLLLLGRPDRARAAAGEALDHERGLGREHQATEALEALGESALAQGDLDAAERFLEQARRRWADARAMVAVARCDQKLGAAATRRGDFERALLSLGAALDGAEGAGDALGAARVRLDLGDVLYRRGDYAEALETFERAVAALRRLDARHDLARGLNRLGNALFQSGRTDAAVARYGEALALARELHDFQSQARLEANLGNVHLVQGEHERALESYRQALAAFEEIGDRTGAGQTRMALGNVCFMRGQLAEAADHYRRSVELREAAADRPGLAHALENLGVAELHLGRFGDALEHHQRSLRLHVELGDRPGHAESLLNLGSVMAVLGDLEAAARTYAEADLAASELGDRRRQARVRLAMACLRIWAVDHAGAAEALAAVEALAVEEPAIRARTLLLRGLSAPSADEGEASLERALEAAERAGSRTEQASVCLALAERHLAAGRIEPAGAALDRAQALVGTVGSPLLDLHGLRLRRAWLERVRPGDAETTRIDRRIGAAIAALRTAQPIEPPRGRDFLAPVFPLP